MVRRVEEEGASEGRAVMGRIGVEPVGKITPRRKPADFPLVLAYVNRGQTDLRKQSRCRRSAIPPLVRLPTIPWSALPQ